MKRPFMHDLRQLVKQEADQHCETVVRCMLRPALKRTRHGINTSMLQAPGAWFDVYQATEALLAGGRIRHVELTPGRLSFTAELAISAGLPAGRCPPRGFGIFRLCDSVMTPLVLSCRKTGETRALLC